MWKHLQCLYFVFRINPNFAYPLSNLDIELYLHSILRGWGYKILYFRHKIHLSWNVLSTPHLYHSPTLFHNMQFKSNHVWGRPKKVPFSLSWKYFFKVLIHQTCHVGSSFIQWKQTVGQVGRLSASQCGRWVTYMAFPEWWVADDQWWVALRPKSRSLDPSQHPYHTMWVEASWYIPCMQMHDYPVAWNSNLALPFLRTVKLDKSLKISAPFPNWWNGPKICVRSKQGNAKKIFSTMPAVKEALNNAGSCYCNAMTEWHWLTGRITSPNASGLKMTLFSTLQLWLCLYIN